MTLRGTKRGVRILTTETPLSTKYRQGIIFIWKSPKRQVFQRTAVEESAHSTA